MSGFLSGGSLTPGVLSAPDERLRSRTVYDYTVQAAEICFTEAVNTWPRSGFSGSAGNPVLTAAPRWAAPVLWIGGVNYNADDFLVQDPFAEVDSDFGIAMLPELDYSIAGSGTAGFAVTVHPGMIQNDGGWRIVIRNVTQFASDRYRVHLGPDGLVTEPVCYPGVAGEGEYATVLNGRFLIVYSPVLPIGTGYRFYFEAEEGTSAISTGETVEVVAHVQRSKVYDMRRRYPPRWYTSARKPLNDPYPQV